MHIIINCTAFHCTKKNCCTHCYKESKTTTVNKIRTIFVQWSGGGLKRRQQQQQQQQQAESWSRIGDKVASVARPPNQKAGKQNEKHDGKSKKNEQLNVHAQRQRQRPTHRQTHRNNRTSVQINFVKWLGFPFPRRLSVLTSRFGGG